MTSNEGGDQEEGQGGELAREREAHTRRADRMEAVGRLAGGVAHDFNNILSGVLGFTSYLMAKTEAGTSLHRDLEMINQSAVRAADFTRRLISLAQTRHVSKEPMSLNDTVSRVVESIEPSLPDTIRTEVRLSPGQAQMIADREGIAQVVRDILQFAVRDLTPCGGVLRVVTEERPLTDRESVVLAGLKSGMHACLTISHNGEALSEEVLEHVFEPFYKPKHSKSKAGLGLSMAYGIVANHHGDILVESAPGRGTTFTICIPHSPEKARREPVAADNAVLQGRETVLIVDDEPVIREMVSQVLGAQGYHVLSAGSGAEALELLGKASADLVLLDLIMPGMSGEKVFRAIREIHPRAAVLLTSGCPQDELTDKLESEGACGLILKPFGNQELLSAIRKVLDR